MKSRYSKFLLALLAVILLSGCASPADQEPAGMFETFPSQFLVGDVYILKDHQKIEGNIAGIGTTLIIEDDAIVMGDITLIGSNLEIAGRLAGDLNVVAGTSTLRNSAIVTGNIHQIFHSVDLEPDALVTGEINTYVFPTASEGLSGEGIVSILDWIQPKRILMVKAGQLIAFTLMALLVIFLFKKPTLKVSNAIQCNLPAAWGAGLLSFIGVPTISLILLITICLSPVGLVLILTFLLAVLWGWIALSVIVGEKLVKWFKLDWQTEPSTIFGAIVVGLLTFLISFIPCLGALINLVIASFGLGGILLSRFGTCEK